MDFLKECLKMKAFMHPHVMGIFGICLDCQAPYIVMPFMVNGSLHTYLRKHRMELLISEDEDIDLVILLNCKHCFVIAFVRYIVFGNDRSLAVITALLKDETLLH